jgi:hypothetical protein
LRWSLLGVACLSRLWACSACRDGEPQCYGQNRTISELEKIVGGADNISARERAPSAAAPLSPPLDIGEHATDIVRLRVLGERGSNQSLWEIVPWGP